MIGVALLMPIDSRRAAGVRHDASIVHLRLNGQMNDVRPVVSALPTVSGFRAGISSQGSDYQRCAGSGESELDSCRSFHKSSGRYDIDVGRFVDGVNAPSSLFCGRLRNTYRRLCHGDAMP
jgi:hypothetical protein